MICSALVMNESWPCFVVDLGAWVVAGGLVVLLAVGLLVWLGASPEPSGRRLGVVAVT